MVGRCYGCILCGLVVGPGVGASKCCCTVLDADDGLKGGIGDALDRWAPFTGG